MRCLELYCGIGGFAAAAKSLHWRVVRAIDINQQAIDVYRHNFSAPVQVRTLESIDAAELAAASADMWWLSPPCQPFTKRGQQRDTTDPRTSSFLHVLELMGQLRPSALALENVPEFALSEAAGRFRSVLRQANYNWCELILCPTEFGIPNRRRRFYLVASQREVPALPLVRRCSMKVAEALESAPDHDLLVGRELVEEYRQAFHVVDPGDPLSVTSCFTAAYGRSHVRSGSYLAQADAVRRFSPREILRLLGFPAWFELPHHLKTTTAWKLVGNSLSVPVVTHVLRSLRTINYDQAA